MSFLVEKYLNTLSFSLLRFRKTGAHTWNFRCPFCSDSKKNKNKARAYVFQDAKGAFFFKCHNCGEPYSFPGFLYRLDRDLYYNYRLDELGGEKYESEAEVVKEKAYDDKVFDTLSRLTNLPSEHIACQFVLKRKIPEKFHKMLFFASQYERFVNSIIPDKLTKGFKGPRLVIPFYGFKRQVVGWQGRALDEHPIRYSTIVIDPAAPRAFGLNEVNFNRKYYVTEGPIDSMFLDNAIAIGGSDLTGGVQKVGGQKENAVIVFDNEPRNNEIVAKLDKAIKEDYATVIWPSHITFKDINDMILGGFTSSELTHLINENTKRGLEAEIFFNEWKRV